MNRRVILLPSLVLLLVAGGAVASTVAAQTASAELETQLAAYVEIQEALAADDFEEAKLQLEAFARVADGGTQVLAEAALLADDIEALRAKFKPLSESLAVLDLPPGFRPRVLSDV